MSFGRSKVERFPEPNIGSSTSKLKRPYMHSSLSNSIVSFDSPITQSENGSAHTKLSVSPSYCSLDDPNNPKHKSERKFVSAGNLTGSKKNKIPNQRVPTLNGSRSRVIISKPSCSPSTHHSGGRFAKKNSKSSASASSKTSLIPNQKLFHSKKNGGSNNDSVVQEEEYSTPATKRKKLEDEKGTATPYELYMTPPQSPQLSPNKNTDLPTEIEETSGTDKKQPFSATPFPLESTRILENSILASWREISSLSINDEPEESMNYDDSSSSTLKGDDEDDENTTITTPGRIPMRRSYHKQNKSSNSFMNATMSQSYLPRVDVFHFDGDRSAPSLADWNEGPSFDFLNNAFMQLSVNESSIQTNLQRTSRIGSGPANNWSIEDLFLQQLESFSGDNSHFPLPSEDNTTSALGSQSFFEWIGDGFSRVLGWKETKREKIPVNGSIHSRQSGADENRHYMTKMNSSNAPKFLRRSREMVHYRVTGEMRRLMRRVRLDARHTLREVKISVVIPAKMHIQSKEFWMPIVEFAAGQVVEIMITSLQL